jgi:hypothetical protein
MVGIFSSGDGNNFLNYLLGCDYLANSRVLAIPPQRISPPLLSLVTVQFLCVHFLGMGHDPVQLIKYLECACKH